MPAVQNYPRINRFKETSDFRQYLDELGINLPVEDEILTAAQGSPLAAPATVYGKTVGNRWCIHPMEGWDGTESGMPSEYTLRRWKNFGLSGAKLIFGGEAVAVRHDGRANPNQLLYKPENKDGFAQLYNTLTQAHTETFGSSDDLLLGLQLTHSGRFSRPDPDHKQKPRVLYHHPILDKRVGIAPNDDSAILGDDEIEELIRLYIDAAKMAQDVGFEFVDVKHCHGYLGHEFLSAYTRPGKFGGPLENRTRFLRSIAEGIRSEAPGLGIAIRISAFDWVPFCDDEGTREKGKKGVGIPEQFEHCLPYQYGFGVKRDNPLEMDLSETIELLKIIEGMDIPLVNVSCGSPYYNPHIQRPAIFPPSDGYRPPEDPLVGVNRQIQMVRELKEAVPNLWLIGTGYTYLQDYLPHVAQAVVREGWADFVGLGRMVLSYPALPAETLQSGKMAKKAICRTFSDCTTAPRNGMISGCFPLDDFYKKLPEAARLKEIKKG